MNKKYMDFVPKEVNPKKKTVYQALPEKKPIVRKVNGATTEAAEAVKAAKAVKVTKTAKTVKATGAETAEVKFAEEEKKKIEYKFPKTPFINQSKVKKRPLSKNVYQKKIEPPKEEPKGPVTIISKPEKDSKVGIVVAIIITIILGAAAGTVAFLLLPK